MNSLPFAAHLANHTRWPPRTHSISEEDTYTHRYLKANTQHTSTPGSTTFNNQKSSSFNDIHSNANKVIYCCSFIFSTLSIQNWPQKCFKGKGIRMDIQINRAPRHQRKNSKHSQTLHPRTTNRSTEYCVSTIPRQPTGATIQRLITAENFEELNLPRRRRVYEVPCGDRNRPYISHTSSQIS